MYAQCMYMYVYKKSTSLTLPGCIRERPLGVCTSRSPGMGTMDRSVMDGNGTDSNLCFICGE